MKTRALWVVVSLLIVTSAVAIPQRSTFAIHLIAGPVDARDFAQRGQWKNLPLAGMPIISEADILAYDFSKHAIRLKLEALRRLPRPPVAGTPFVVVVNGERIYPGAFYTSVSSISCELPVIVVDRVAQSQAADADVLLIERAYPPTIAFGKDLRSDIRVRDVLSKLKKLAPL
jgi:hypothetical protein